MKTIIEPEREIPVWREVDVVVAGGGPAGIAAAIASARLGAKTLLVERYGYLGGMITGSYVLWVIGMGNGERQIIQGIAQEFYDRLAPLGGAKESRKCGDYNVDAEMFKWMAVVMLREAGAKLLLHSLVCDAVKEKESVRGIVVENKSGRGAILAKVCIDATADGDLSHFAGAPYKLDTHDINLMITVDGVDRERVEAFAKEAPERFKVLMKEAKEKAGGAIPPKARMFKDYETTDAAHLTAIEIEARTSAMEGLLFLREHLPGYEKAKISNTAPQLGVREGRRIAGNYILTDEDILGSRKFPDTVLRSGVYLSMKEVKGIEYDVPYRCLIPQKVQGLLTSGRCISTTHGACNSMRLIPPCFATGQAAGVAGALAAMKGIQPHQVPVEEIQSALKSQGAYLG